MILIVNSVESSGIFDNSKELTLAVRLKVKVFAEDKSIVTTLEEIVSASTCSEYAFSLVSPSISSFALGDAVPRPTLLLEVEIAVPTFKLFAVTIPALMFASVRVAFDALRIPATLMLVTVVRPAKYA